MDDLILNILNGIKFLKLFYKFECETEVVNEKIVYLKICYKLTEYKIKIEKVKDILEVAVISDT